MKLKNQFNMKLLGVYFISKNGCLCGYKRLPRKIKKLKMHFTGDVSFNINYDQMTSS